jgi:hypothetical protein
MTKALSSYSILARLRLSVLAAGEALPDKYWDSKGLSTTGQGDLIAIFPRTSLLAAMTHATELARAHHDKQTRASGVYHLFRLPTDIETAIHHEMIESIPNDYDVQTNLWSEIDELPKTDVEAEEGSINLNTLDLSTTKAISKLAATYKSAMDTGLTCIPFFQIAE